MSESAKKKERPVYRNVDFNQLKNYDLPAPGKVSILHRVSGALLFLSLPIILVPIFKMSVESPLGFEQLGSGFSGFLLKLILLVLIWAFMHHLCAGVRFLLLDLHYGLQKEKALKSARLVFIVSLILTAVFGIKMFWVL